MPTEITYCQVCLEKRHTVDTRATRSLSLPEPFRIHRCHQCAFRWLNPQPTDSEYSAIYQSGYFANDTNKNITNLNSLFPAPQVDYENNLVASRRPSYAARLDRLRKINPGVRSIFDVGAATGDLLAVAQSKGWFIAGLEPSSHACERAREKYGIAVSCCSLYDYHYDDRRYDVVHLHHVFEHLGRPDQALSAIKSLMHAESLLVMEVPNQFTGLLPQLLRIKNGPAKRTLYSIHHPVFYNAKNLLRLLQRFGMRVHSIRTFFPERRIGSFKTKLLTTIDQVADWCGRRGSNIEIIASIDNS